MPIPDPFQKMLLSVGLERVEDEIARAVLPALVIQTARTSESEIAPGTSKFGGIPDVPSGFEWPLWDDVPQSFLCQINLAELSGLTASELLPVYGVLSFFYDAKQTTWGFDPKDGDSWAVYFFEEELFRAELPEEIENEHFFSCSLRFEDGFTLPGWETDEIQSLKLSEKELDGYFELLEHELEPNHHLLGHPQEIQGPMPLECQLASNGLYCGSPAGYNDPRAKGLEARASDWILLLQIDSDESPDWMWGDCGRLYFWIRKQDLQEQKFDRVWMILQCG